MFYRLDDEQVGFPDPRLAEEDGLLAMGGDMSPEWLLNAYALGIFPWYDDEEGTPYWYSLDPRMVMLPADFRCSKSLRRLLMSHRLEVRVDTCFRQVMEWCSKVDRKGQPSGSWISDNFMDRYCELYEYGYAHSFETFLDDELVGGLYGVSISDFFSGESMFHLVRDASKVAFAHLVDFAAMHGFRFIDAQQPTPHLASLGAKPMKRDSFLDLLNNQNFDKTYQGRWHNNSVTLLIGGNQGDRLALIVRAVMMIGERIGKVSSLSQVYETEPWGFEAQRPFLNQAVVVDTDLDAHRVLREALAIEQELGRQRPEGVKGYSSRPMDIDIIFFNGDVIDTPDLVVPHPRMQLRRFVLQPLVEIMPDFRHPKLLKTVRELWDDCPDKGAVKVCSM